MKITPALSKPTVDLNSLVNKESVNIKSQRSNNQLLADSKNKMGPVRKQTNPRRNFCCS